MQIHCRERHCSNGKIIGPLPLFAIFQIEDVCLVMWSFVVIVMSASNQYKHLHNEIYGLQIDLIGKRSQAPT